MNKWSANSERFAVLISHPDEIHNSTTVTPSLSLLPFILKTHWLNFLHNFVYGTPLYCVFEFETFLEGRYCCLHGSNDSWLQLPSSSRQGQNAWRKLLDHRILGEEQKGNFGLPDYRHCLPLSSQIQASVQRDSLRRMFLSSTPSPLFLSSLLLLAI